MPKPVIEVELSFPIVTKAANQRSQGTSNLHPNLVELSLIWEIPLGDGVDEHVDPDRRKGHVAVVAENVRKFLIFAAAQKR